MILPVGDTPNPPGRPLVTWTLIAVNVAVYLWITVPLSSVRPEPSDPLLLHYIRLLAESSNISPKILLEHVSAYDLFLFRYGFRSAEPGLAPLFSAVFLHAGFAHLFGNMLFLWIYGDNVEYRLGRFWFLVAYLACGAAATIFFTLFAGDSHLPMIGASGAISGVLGFYFLWFPGNKVKLFFFFFPFFMDTVLVPARLVLGFYLIIENLLPFFLTQGDGGGVAYGAHIGGFLAGLLWAAMLNRSPWRTGKI